jgi:hypothetical protein
VGIVKLIQFVHPHGSKEETSVEVSDEVLELSKGQVLTCECMPHDYSKVVFYSYPEGADPDENPEVEECMIGENGPGENSPKNTLEKLIRLVAGKISAQNQENARLQPLTTV